MPPALGHVVQRATNSAVPHWSDQLSVSAWLGRWWRGGCIRAPRIVGRVCDTRAHRSSGRHTAGDAFLHTSLASCNRRVDVAAVNLAMKRGRVRQAFLAMAGKPRLGLASGRKTLASSKLEQFRPAPYLLPASGLSRSA